MTKALSRKPYYTLAEACERWGLSNGDVAAYALEGELSLSFPVAALQVEVSEFEHDIDGRRFSIPLGRRRHVGTLELDRVDAFNALEHGGATVARFFSPEGGVIEPLDESGERCAVPVDCSALVVRHPEFERFEARQVKLPPLGTSVPHSAEPPKRGRGAPEKYDWEGVLCAMIVVVNDEGVPATQAEMIDKMRGWFEQRLGSDNVPCDSSIKRRVIRFWDQIKPNVGKPSALQNINTVRQGGQRETARLGKP